METRIFLVEDHPIFRRGLVDFINNEPDLQVCGEADDVGAALAGIAETRPHLALVDLRLKSSSGIDLIQDLRAQWPELRMLVMSMYEESRYAERLFQLGVLGYVMKDQGPRVVLQAIRSVIQGVPYASDEVKEQILLHGFQKRATDALTNRELQIFQMLGEGHGVADIAGILNRSDKTVQNHIDHIRRKLNVRSRQELYQRAKEWAMKAGF